MGTAAHLLKDKAATGTLGVVTIDPSATALEAARRMNDHHIGALVVVDSVGRVAGIVSERDVLVRVVAAQRAPERTAVGEVMTREVLVCSPDTPLDELRRLMRTKRVRHIPIVDEQGLSGMVSIGDLNLAEARELSETIVFLEQFMSPR